MKKFSKEHEWISLEGNIATIGVSDYAQKQLGDVVYVSLTCEVGDDVSTGDDIAEIESVKSVSQLYAPVDGKVTEFNEDFDDEANSGLINTDPYGKGWILKMEVSDTAQVDALLTEEAYEEYIKTL